MPETPEYGIGDVVVYRAFGGEVRRVRVTNRDPDVKGGQSGFDGVLLETAGTMHKEASCWGYDSQIVSVERMREHGMREFTRMDWQAFSGATQFADGAEPLIGETTGAVVIADQDGVAILFQDNQLETFEFRSPYPLVSSASTESKKDLARRMFEALTSR